MSKAFAFSCVLVLAAQPALATVKHHAAAHPAPAAATAPPAPAPAALPADADAAFTAAGMVKKAGHWTGCPDDDNGVAQVEPGDYRDLNGDGSADMIINDYSGYCYGNTGQGFFVVTKVSGKWTKLYNSPGIATFLPTKVKTPGGWPDVEVGGPGFCFPVLRWSGKDYVFLRNHEYDKGACKREGM